MTPRPYQQEFVDAVKHSFSEGHKRIMGEAATGAGKTIIASMIMKEEAGNCLFLADATDLVTQNADKFTKYSGEKCGIDMASQHAIPGRDRVVVATTQSIVNRLDKYPDDYFNLIIVDECFPAGTLVDGKPIEEFRIGDPITAFDEKTGKLEESVVTDVMQKQASELVEIKSGEYSITCTPNHPIWTQRGWQPAALVNKNDWVLTTATHEKTKRSSNGNLRGLWNRISSHFFAGSQSEIQTRFGLDMFTKVPKQTLLRASESPESDVQQGNSRKGIHQTSSNGMETERKRWKWKTLTSGAITNRLHAWMGNGSCNQDKDAAWQRIPHLLQGRHRESRVEDRYRNRRQFTSRRNRKTTRHKEGRVLKWNRVEGVAILEGGSSKFTESGGGSCNVYNLSVAKYHTYVANGIVVHNCHRNTLGEQAQKVFEHFSYAKVLGVTATPFRSDRKSLSDFYETIAVQIGLARLIREGYLSPIQIKSVPMKVDLTQIAKRGGDYSSEELGDVIEPILELAAQQIRDHARDRKKIVVFLPLIKTSIRMARILNEMGIKACHVSGDDRSEMSQFTHGDARVVCNAQLLSTGWDYPPVDCVMVLRPTKSLSLYCQFVGRGTRIHPGKENLLLLDPLYMSDDHKLINPARLTARTQEQADAMMEEVQSDVGGEGRDLLTLDQDIEEQRAEALRTRMKQKERKAMRLVDAVEFAVHCDELETAEFEPEFGWECTGPTEKQIQTLESAGIETAEITTRGQADKLLDLLFVRRKRGLATPKQLRLLRRFNHPDAANVTFAEASVFLDAKFSKNRKTTDRQTLPTSLMIQLREAGLKPSAYASVKEANKALDEVLPF